MQAQRACLGLLSLQKRYGNERLERACTIALQIVEGPSHDRGQFIREQADRYDFSLRAARGFAAEAGDGAALPVVMRGAFQNFTMRTPCCSASRREVGV